MNTRLDFSRFSKVQASLKEELMARFDNERRVMRDDELDMVAAASSGLIIHKPGRKDFNTEKK